MSGTYNILSPKTLERGFCMGQTNVNNYDRFVVVAHPHEKVGGGSPRATYKPHGAGSVIRR